LHQLEERNEGGKVLEDHLADLQGVGRALRQSAQSTQGGGRDRRALLCAAEQGSSSLNVAHAVKLGRFVSSDVESFAELPGEEKLKSSVCFDEQMCGLGKFGEMGVQSEERHLQQKVLKKSANQALAYDEYKPWQQYPE
jgi:hypothetical protein